VDELIPSLFHEVVDLAVVVLRFDRLEAELDAAEPVARQAGLFETLEDGLEAFLDGLVVPLAALVADSQPAGELYRIVAPAEVAGQQMVVLSAVEELGCLLVEALLV
jgi:hypothetical protein